MFKKTFYTLLAALLLTISTASLAAEKSEKASEKAQVSKVEKTEENADESEAKAPAGFKFSEESSRIVGMAKPWQINFSAPASPVKERLNNLHNGLLYMVFGISIFVLGLIVYACIKFREKANPIPSKTTHNSVIEVIWTVVPILILLAIVIPSWKLINYMNKAKDPEITLKAIGYQWYWGYEYMDGIGKGITFESYMKTEDATDPSQKLQPGEPRLLEVDNRVVLPINTDIRILTTGADVIHSFAMPTFGIKMDAVPGKVNETWVRINKRGVFYGQCSELCGSKHAFMPIAVQAVTKEEYKAWVKSKGGYNGEKKKKKSKKSDKSEEKSEDSKK